MRSDRIPTSEERRRAVEDMRGESSVTNAKKKEKDFSGIVRNFLNVLMNVVSALVEFFRWLLYEGMELIFGVATVYCVFVNTESWSFSLNNRAPFIPKPFIEDGANLLNLFNGNVPFGAFAFAFLVSIAIAGIEAWAWRDITPDEAKAKYDAVKNYTASEPSEEAIEIVHYHLRRYKKAGTKKNYIKLAVLVLAYTVDISQSYQTYPLFTAALMLNLTWFIVNLVGAEYCLTLWLDAREKNRQEAKKAEVV